MDASKSESRTASADSFRAPGTSREEFHFRWTVLNHFLTLDKEEAEMHVSPALPSYTGGCAGERAEPRYRVPAQSRAELGRQP